MITIVAWKYYALCALATIGAIGVLCVCTLLILGVVAFSGSGRISRGAGYVNP